MKEGDVMSAKKNVWKKISLLFIIVSIILFCPAYS